MSYSFSFLTSLMLCYSKKLNHCYDIRAQGMLISVSASLSDSDITDGLRVLSAFKSQNCTLYLVCLLRFTGSLFDKLTNEVQVT